MLKLEKVAKTLEVSVTLRKRERFFNRPLLLALGIALGLHALAAFIFHVRPFIILGSQAILPPMEVDADLSGISEGSVTAQAENEEAAFKNIKEPKGATLALPCLEPSPLPSARCSLETQQEFKKNPFAELEYGLLDNPFIVPPSRPDSKLRILPSGPLADRSLIVAREPGAQIDLKAPYRTLFAVNVESRSGEIFWFEPLHESTLPLADKKAENILKNLRFEPSLSSFAESGEVEIVFFPEEA